MQAFKCDRCGVFYGKYKLTNDYAFRGAPIKVSSGDVGLDLCSDCRKKLVEFLKDGKNDIYEIAHNCDPGFYVKEVKKACGKCKFEDGYCCTISETYEDAVCVNYSGFEPKED